MIISFQCKKARPGKVESGAYKRHEVAQRSVRHAWISGSNCCPTLLCAFYHLRIVLTAEAIVALQEQMAKYTRKP